MTPIRALPFAILAIAAALPLRAAATDTLVCRSKTYHAELAVGADGTVASLVLDDASGKRVPEPATVTTLDPKHRNASLEHKSVDVEAKTGLTGADRLVIRLEHGQGYVDVGGDTEPMACDFTR